MKLLTDISLDEIIFSSDGKNITFKFIDIYKGNPANTIKCLSISSFNYENIFDEEKGLPCYISEVTCTKILKQDTISYFKKTNLKVNSIDDSDEELFILRIEGGDIIIDVICKSINQSIT